MSATRRAVWLLFFYQVLGVSFGDDSPSHFLQILQPEGDFSDCVDAERFEEDLIGACNIRVSNLQKGVKDQAAGTFEGDYFPFGCHDGHLAYASIDDGERILWYSREYQDWNINAGLEAKPDEVLAFGSDLSADSEAQRPLYSGARSWWVVRRPELRTSLEDMFTEAKGLQVTCAEGPSAV